MFEPEIQRKIIEIIAPTWVALYWGAAYHFYKVSKGEAFIFWKFLLSLFLAWFVGYVAWKIMPDALNTDLRDGLIAMSGFSTFPILDLLERKWLFFLVKKMGIEDTAFINQNKDGK